MFPRCIANLRRFGSKLPSFGKNWTRFPMPNREWLTSCDRCGSRWAVKSHFLPQRATAWNKQCRGGGLRSALLVPSSGTLLTSLFSLRGEKCGFSRCAAVRRLIGDREVKRCASADGGSKPNPSPVPLDDLLADRQADSRARILATVQAAEGAENLLEALFRDADAVSSTANCQPSAIREALTAPWSFVATELIPLSMIF